MSQAADRGAGSGVRRPRGRRAMAVAALLLAPAAVACSRGDEHAPRQAAETGRTAAAPPTGQPRRRPRGAARRQSRQAPVIAGDARRYDPATTEGAAVTVLAPAEVTHRQAFPVVVRVLDGSGQVDPCATGWLSLMMTGETEPAGLDVLLRRGVGSVTTDLSAAGDFSLRVAGAGGPARRVRVTSAEPRRLAGRLAAPDLRWERGRQVEVTGELTVPAGAKLAIEAGVTVRLRSGVNLLVDGDLEALGSEEEPVLFVPADRGQPWGGIVHRGDARYRWAVLTGGGGDASRRYGHSGSQAMLFADEGAHLVLEHCALQDAVGKGVGARGATVELRDSLVTRTDMGGELIDSAVHVERSHFLDFPAQGVPYRDDDNDALYLHGFLRREGQPLPSTVRDTTFIGGLDDGIDHNGALVEIERCWIEGFSHEGVAASAGGWVRITDTAVVGCEQGIEAGAGAPGVTADHVLLTENDVGARFGDAYRSRYTGSLRIANSVVVGNRRHALWNYLYSTRAPSPRGIEVRHSLVDANSWDRGGDNVVGAAQLDGELLLAPGSPGHGIAEDGSDPGLLTGRPR